MRLHDIVKSEGANRPKRRVGRGEGSGHGKTSGRGHKGQKSRAGFSQRPGFESGHIPLYRKLPKRGFNNKDFRKDWVIVNLSAIANLEESEVDKAVLAKHGLIRRSDSPLKVLGSGDLDRAVTVRAAKFSASAKEKIEKAGGKAVVVEAAGAAEPEADKSSQE